MTIPAHPLAALFPMMNGAEFDELTRSIKANGLRKRIMLTKDGTAILDGRNRYAACQSAGVEPEFKRYDFDDMPTMLAYVSDVNNCRRHLTTSQRAAIAVAIANMTHGGHRDGQAAKSQLGVSRAAAAKAMGVSERSVNEAAAIKKKSPEAFEAIKAGKVTVGAASRPKPAAERPKLTVVPAVPLQEEDDGGTDKERWERSCQNFLGDVMSMRAFWNRSFPGWEKYKLPPALHALVRQAEEEWKRLASKIGDMK